MIMRKFQLLPAAALLLLAGTASAQGISGTVQDNADKPLPAVTISLLSAKDSSLLKTEVTDANGRYEINTGREGNLLIRYSSIGFEPHYSAVFEKRTGRRSGCPLLNCNPLPVN